MLIVVPIHVAVENGVYGGQKGALRNHAYVLLLAAAAVAVLGAAHCKAPGFEGVRGCCLRGN